MSMSLADPPAPGIWRLCNHPAAVGESAGSSADTRASLPPKTISARYESLDICRGAACLMLLFFHGTFYAERAWRFDDSSSWSLGAGLIAVTTRLWIGVPIFFVVSGYCIAASIQSRRRKPQSLGTYFTRRFRRIYPPLWIMLGLAVVFTLSLRLAEPLAAEYENFTPLDRFTAWNWIGNFFAAETWRPRVVGDTANYLLKNTWTLAYEEQFYLVCGLLLLCGARRFFAVAALVTVLSLASRHVSRALDLPASGFFFDGHWLLFAAGLLVYKTLTCPSPKAVGLTAAILVAGIVYAVADQRMTSFHWERHLDSYMVVAFGFALVLIFLKRWDAIIAEWRLLRPLHWCGRISYSIYLTHFPLVVVLSIALAKAGWNSDWHVLLVTLPLCLAVSLPVAWLFHVLVERRFMNA